MQARALCVASLVLLVLFWGSIAGILRQQAPTRHPASLVAHVRLPGSGTGSGTPIAHQGGRTAVLTAAHVVSVTADPTELVVELDGMSYPVKVAVAHPSLDLAIVWVVGRLPLVEVDFHAPEMGDRLLAAGWLFGEQLHLAEGLMGEKGKLSVDVMPGCSGGPVFRDGRVNGVVVATVSVSSPFGSIPLGVSADFVPLCVARDWLRAMLGM